MPAKKPSPFAGKETKREEKKEKKLSKAAYIKGEKAEKKPNPFAKRVK